MENKDSQTNLVEIPITIKADTDGTINIVSIKTSRAYFREPFFIDSLVKKFNILESQIELPKENELLARPVHYDPNNSSVTTSKLEDYVNKYSKSIPLNIFCEKTNYIFHMSRCGSTLLTQMLSSTNKFYVLSEPTIINAVLDPNLIISENERETLLRSCLNNLLLSIPQEAEKMIIKFRSWNILLIDLILKSTPSVNWVFIHRNGNEVLASVLKKQPGWLRSKNLYYDFFAKILKTNKQEIKSMNGDEFAIKLLAEFCQKAILYNGNKNHFIDYKDLKNDIDKLIEKIFVVKLSKGEKQAIIKTSNIYSKDVEKNKHFVSDTEEKQKQINEDQRSMIEKLIEPIRIKLYENKNYK